MLSRSIDTITLIVAVVLATGALGYAQDRKPIESSSPQNTEAIQPKSDSQKATIYFYRIKQFAGSGLEPSVYCDDKELARMENGRLLRSGFRTRQTYLPNGRQANGVRNRYEIR